MKKFEYTVLDVPFKGFWNSKVDHGALAQKLNELGKNGWEVATLTDTNMYQGSSKTIIIILKRELSH